MHRQLYLLTIQTSHPPPPKSARPSHLPRSQFPSGRVHVQSASLTPMFWRLQSKWFPWQFLSSQNTFQYNPFIHPPPPPRALPRCWISAVPLRAAGCCSPHGGLPGSPDLGCLLIPPLHRGCKRTARRPEKLLHILKYIVI